MNPLLLLPTPIAVRPGDVIRVITHVQLDCDAPRYHFDLARLHADPRHASSSGTCSRSRSSRDQGNNQAGEEVEVLGSVDINYEDLYPDWDNEGDEHDGVGEHTHKLEVGKEPVSREMTAGLFRLFKFVSHDIITLSISPSGQAQLSK
jgi:hypothetical protein